MIYMNYHIISIKTHSKDLKSQFGVSKIDILFLDHDKNDYLPTLRNLENLGLIGKDSLIIADNAIYPGCPDFLIYVRTAPSFYKAGCNTS